MRGVCGHVVETPLGGLHIIFEGENAVAIALTCDDAAYPPARSPLPALVEEIARSIEVYFAGGDADTSLAVRLIKNMDATPFEESVLREVSALPRGETASYGEIASRAGYPRAARAVGNTMHRNPFPVIIPCHRVIRADGGLGGYGGADFLKEWLLRFEAGV